MGRKVRRGFTLVEFVIVAIIISVLAATILPQCSSSSRETKMSNLKFNLHSVRSQLEKYKEQHRGAFPPAATSADFSRQMTGKSDQAAMLNVAGPFGPYLEGGIPVNPFNGSASVAIIRGNTPPTAPTGSEDGWQYNPIQGWFYPNDPDYFRAAQGTN